MVWSELEGIKKRWLLGGYLSRLLSGTDGNFSIKKFKKLKEKSG